MGMWVWAAEGTTKTSWDYLLEALTPMVALVGVIAVAWVGIRTARKGPYDRLDTLVKVLDTWPTGLTGREAVERLVARVVLDIRVREGDVERPGASAAEASAERSVIRTFRYLRGTLALFLITVALLIFQLVTAEPPTYSGGQFVGAAVAALFAAAAATLLAFARSRANDAARRLLNEERSSKPEKDSGS
ncbi:hypothetical protein OPAG_09279 [Rhodococcus opacus PD630]|uniref:hypothetical protein n=1 Tax=Rhodococcus opacus TaxID=37919 RepID=UPI00029CCAE4|nr:hypothetical protein [Rhodococcus opacus]EHI39097.1 hypothetical protein OPAG_09279 [Rhodococcus opacus PD630]UDH01746.1 hypothetical protein K2Z90_008274 [Rhodococcus opacus PD630]